MIKITRHIQDFYAQERLNALILIVLAIVMMGVAYIVFRNIKANIVYGLSGSLVALSLVQMLSSIIIYIRTLKYERKLLPEPIASNLLIAEHQSIKNKVLRFPKLRMVQEIFFGLSFVGVFLGMAEVINPISMGIAIVLLLQMAIWIVLGLFAQRRTQEYERRLRRHIETAQTEVK